jgi:uridine kinase
MAGKEKKTLSIYYGESGEKRIDELIPKEAEFKYVRAQVDGRLRELSYVVKGPVKIELYPVAGDAESMYIYKNTLMYVLAMAIHNVAPSVKFLFSNDVSRSIYIAPLNTSDNINVPLMKKIQAEVERIVQANYKIEKKLISKEEAIKIYQEEGMDDKLAILNYRPEGMVHLYQCDSYFDYLYGYMAPSTGYVSLYHFIPRLPGFLVQFPRSEEDGNIPPFEAEPVFERTLEETRDWSKKVGLDTISGINGYAKEFGPTDFIMMCESHCSNQLAELGTMIAKSSTPIRLICIAGPSSSGKTTFANRLRLELLSQGMFPIRISCDDYYKEKKDLVPEDDGSYDLESINAIDVDLFNSQMLSLIEGEEVTLPHFNFIAGKREDGRKLKLGPNEPLIVEGIHALNEKMTSNIAQHNKFKIFIAPQAQINIDDHAPISLTDLRLLRRIVRDSKFRHSSAEDTIMMWPSVRHGEFAWIYKTQEEANYVFNSLLPYELCVMRKYALPQLSAVPKTSPAYVTCRRLCMFLKYFTDLDEKDVPDNSLMREFIGGSCFKDV